MVAAEPAAMCLLHGDFHSMSQECWSRVVDYYVTHLGMDMNECRHVYLEETERHMLDRWARTGSL